MNYKVIYGKNDLVYTVFLALPGKLYQKNELTQDYDTEYKLLHEKHTLSKYFNITPFVVIDKNSQMPVARCMLTYYPEDDVAYFGFFECIGQQEIAEQLLDTVSKKAKKDGKTKLSGPVDASFWIKYRLKINLFDRIPYTGEPYNKNYYYKLLSDCGFVVQNHYTSNIYPIIDMDYYNEKFEKRYEQFLNKGYEIKSPAKKNYPYIMEKVYELIMDLYSDFPAFKYIEKEDFMDIVLRLFMSSKKKGQDDKWYSMSVPMVFLDVTTEKDLDFESIAYAFISGLISDKYEPKNDEQTTEEGK